MIVELRFKILSCCCSFYMLIFICRRNGATGGTFKRILFLLAVSSGFLLIIYANNDLFTNKQMFSMFQRQDLDIPVMQHRIKYVHKKNTTEYNIFLIYTKENQALKHKLELFLKSLLKYSSIPVHLHIITDDRSLNSLESSINANFHKYRMPGRPHLYTIYDIQDAVVKIKDIHEALMPLFSYSAGSYYSDALFLLSLGLYRIVDIEMKYGILLDCDIVFRADVKELFDEFKKFTPDNLFGLGPELTPVYRHVLYKYRLNNPFTNFGNPYFLHLLPQRDSKPNIEHIKHGYPGLNSGVIMLNFDAIRHSKHYEETLRPENVRTLVRKYSFKGHLGDQDFYTLLGYEFPALIYYLDCIWNRQLCTWWKLHGYGEVFDAYFHCQGKIKIYHGNCNTRVPE